MSAYPPPAERSLQWSYSKLLTRKRKRAGITVGNLGTLVFSTEDCLERVREAEAVTTARQTQGKERAVPVGTQHTLDDVHTVLGLLDYDVHGLDSFGDGY